MTSSMEMKPGVQLVKVTELPDLQDNLIILNNATQSKEIPSLEFCTCYEVPIKDKFQLHFSNIDDVESTELPLMKITNEKTLERDRTLYLLPEGFLLACLFNKPLISYSSIINNIENGINKLDKSNKPSTQNALVKSGGHNGNFIYKGRKLRFMYSPDRLVLIAAYEGGLPLAGNTLSTIKLIENEIFKEF